MRGTDGLLVLESFREMDSSDLDAIGRWLTIEEERAGLPKPLAIGGRSID